MCQRKQPMSEFSGYSRRHAHLRANMHLWPSWSKALHSSRSLFEGVGSNPTGCISKKKFLLR